MRKLFMLLSAVAVVGCARGEEDIVADSPAAAELPSPLTFADFAGRWSIQLLGDMNDTVLTSFEMNATADGLFDKHRKASMKAYKRALSSEEIKELVGYVRKFKK